MDFLGVRKNRTKARPLLTRESPSYPRRAARRGGHQIHVAAAARFALVAEPPPGPKSSRAHAKPRDRAGTPPKRRAGARDAVAVQVLATNDAEGQQVARVARVSRSHYFEADGALLALLQRLPPPLPRLFFFAR